MRNFLYALLALGIIAAVVIILNWNAIMAWWNGPDSTPALSCQQEYDAAQAEWAKSGQSCILTVENVICPTDASFIASTNPCVAALLKEKGWKSPAANDPNNNNANNNSVQYDLEVSNPQGAYMYYQSVSPASQGMIYGASNMLLPLGTKLKLVNTWQTNLSTQPFAGYYETTFKQNGPESGFFNISDIKKL